MITSNKNDSDDSCWCSNSRNANRNANRDANWCCCCYCCCYCLGFFCPAPLLVHAQSTIFINKRWSWWLWCQCNWSCYCYSFLWPCLLLNVGTKNNELIRWPTSFWTELDATRLNLASCLDLTSCLALTWLTSDLYQTKVKTIDGYIDFLLANFISFQIRMKKWVQYGQ